MHAIDRFILTTSMIAIGAASVCLVVTRLVG